MMTEFIQIGFTFLISVVGGGVTGIMCIASMKNDISWIKILTDEHKGRLNNHGDRISKIERDLYHVKNKGSCERA